MTIKDAYQFLDLPEGSGKDLIAAQYRGKYNFFKMLHSNAPSAIIRDLQEKNLQKLEEIKKLLTDLLGPDVFLSAPGNQSVSPQKSSQASSKEEKINGSFDPENKDTLAYLVVHTENKDTESFPLFEGDNPVGRHEVEGQESIIITEDIYVSRYHCSIIIRNSFGKMSAEIADDGRFSNSKPSLNGTYYNGDSNRIKSQKLNNGDTVQIGMTKMVFKWKNAKKEEIEEEVALTGFVRTIVVNI